MKHRIKFLLAFLLICMVFPMTAYAETYDMNDTDLSICLDDTSWYVFTRDNLKNNSDLDELGLAYDTMYSILIDNMAYMDAFQLYEDGDFLELFVRKKTIENSFVNLSNYDNEQVLEVAQEFAKINNIENYSVYQNQYKFIRVEYFDSNVDLYICEFITIVNKDNYTLTFQSPSPFADWKIGEIENIVDSVSFDVDLSIEELIPPSLNEPQTPSIFDNVIDTFITSAISGFILAIIVFLFSKIKKARKIKKNDNVPDDIPELKKVWYEKECIFVEFQSGHITKYISVPDKMYFAMCNAPKKSKYLFEYIVGNFEAEDVKKADPKESPEIKVNNQVVPNKLECQPKAGSKDNISVYQESTSQKDVEVDKCFDDIKKYKELLDLGIITQEEFDTKKKELLGL